MTVLAVGQLREITCFELFLYPQQCESSTDGTIYKYKAKTLNGSHTVNFSDYTGKSVLFINVATYWGYTFQYVGKNQHHRPHKFIFQDLKKKQKQAAPYQDI